MCHREYVYICLLLVTIKKHLLVNSGCAFLSRRQALSLRTVVVVASKLFRSIARNQPRVYVLLFVERFLASALTDIHKLALWQSRALRAKRPWPTKLDIRLGMTANNNIRRSSLSNNV